MRSWCSAGNGCLRPPRRFFRRRPNALNSAPAWSMRLNGDWRRAAAAGRRFSPRATRSAAASAARCGGLRRERNFVFCRLRRRFSFSLRGSGSRGSGPGSFRCTAMRLRCRSARCCVRRWPWCTAMRSGAPARLRRSLLNVFPPPPAGAPQCAAVDQPVVPRVRHTTGGAMRTGPHTAPPRMRGRADIYRSCAAQ